MCNNAWISIGSNMNDPKMQADLAIKYLQKLPKTKIINCSQYYRSEPFGIKNQPDFLNAVVKLYTCLSPKKLLIFLKKIEHDRGRIRNITRWGPRTLDLDILLFANNTYNFSNLIIPHYDIYNRSFFLYPLLEISPNLVFPDGTTLIYRLSKVQYNNLKLWK